MRIFFDVLERTVITEDKLNKFAPPERYYEILQSNILDSYVEKWYCDGNKYINIYYNKLNKEHVNSLRKTKAELCNVELRYMNHYFIPKEKYEKIIDFLNRGDY